MDNLRRLVNLREGFVGPGRPNRPGTPILPRFITIHNTSNTSPRANASMHSVFVQKTGYYVIQNTGKKNWVSCDFTTDDREAIQHLPLNEKALHAGAANMQSVAIEVCMHKGIDQKAANERAAALTAMIAHDLALGPNAIRTH